jgi:ATP-dependent RNA helicase CshB
MNYTGEVYSFYTELDDLYLDNLAKKGVKPIYKVIKEGSLEDYKGRNAREKRIKPLNEGQKRARKIIHKPDKVTPGYKKKLRKAQDELSVKLYKAEGKKKKRRGN